MSTGLPSTTTGIDFLISYARGEQAWAEWVAWELEAAGCHVRLWSRDVLPGENSVLWTVRQLDAARFLVALYSPTYFQSGRCMSELASALRRDVLLPVRVAPCQPPELLGATTYETLFGLTEQDARRRLRRIADAARAPSPPLRDGWASGSGGRRPTFPGSPRLVRRTPARNPGFVGRDQTLATLRDEFRSADPERLTTVIVTGVAGSGKTQLALEYAHRHSDAYALVWWLPASLPEVLTEAFDGLADALGVPDHLDRVRRARLAVRCLAEYPRWLLVFDDVHEPGLLADWLPDRGGHVLVTGRSRALGHFGRTVEVGRFTVAESAALLRHRAGHIPDDDLSHVAVALDHLPLAIGQAGAFLGTTRITAATYLMLLRSATAEVLRHGPVDYPAGLIGSVATALSRLAEHEPMAADLVCDAAFLAPEPLGPVVLRALAAHADEPLVVVAAALRGVEGSGLAWVDSDTFQLHRLTQAAIRGWLGEAESARIAGRVGVRLAAAVPTAPDDPSTWPVFEALAVHVQTLLEDLPDSGSGFRAAVLDVAHYLTRSGQYGAALACAARALGCWRAHHGEDHQDVLRVAYRHAEALRASGKLEEAELLDRAVHGRRLRTLGRSHRETLHSADALALDHWGLGRRREALRGHSRAYRTAKRAFGPDDQQTLELASNLALDLYGLGHAAKARALDERTLSHRRRILGDEHPATLASARGLAHDLRKLRAHDEALALDGRTFEASRRVLGIDHPDTLAAAGSLAVDHYATGDYRAARELHEDTLYRSQRILGPDHPITLRVANGLGLDLYRVGELARAHQVHRDTVNRLTRTLGAENPMTLHAAHNLARDAYALGRLAEARALWEDTFARRRHVLGARHPETRRTERKIRQMGYTGAIRVDRSE